jgi:hypothetical protein
MMRMVMTKEHEAESVSLDDAGCQRAGSVMTTELCESPRATQ